MLEWMCKQTRCKIQVGNVLPGILYSILFYRSCYMEHSRRGPDSERGPEALSHGSFVCEIA